MYCTGSMYMYSSISIISIMTQIKPEGDSNLTHTVG